MDSISLPTILFSLGVLFYLLSRASKAKSKQANYKDWVTEKHNLELNLNMHKAINREHSILTKLDVAEKRLTASQCELDNLKKKYERKRDTETGRFIKKGD